LQSKSDRVAGKVQQPVGNSGFLSTGGDVLMSGVEELSSGHYFFMVSNINTIAQVCRRRSRLRLLLPPLSLLSGLRQGAAISE
jgi:hypothetical protein